MPVAVKITDDRGRRVPLVRHDWGAARGNTPVRRRLLASTSLSFQRDPAAVRIRPTRGEVVHGIIAGAVALPVLLAAALTPAYLAFSTGLPWWGTILASLPLGVIPALVTIFLARRLARRGIARSYVRAGLCASCGYDLQALDIEGDGCRQCPECGSAWRDPAVVAALAP